MKFDEFIKAAEESKYETIGFDGDNPVLRNVDNDIKISFTRQAIEDNSWSDIEEVMNGERTTAPLEGMSRVVGYLSRHSNWNVSKKGELKDRQNGNYVLK